MKLYFLTILLIGYLSNLDNVDSMFIESLESFSVNLYKTVARHESGNVLLSPLSANLALSMVVLGARGNTKRELLQTLYLEDHDAQIKYDYSSLYYTLPNVNSSELNILNKAFISTNLNVKQTYKDVLTRYFHAEEEQLDFSNAGQAARSINTWVSRGTNGKINQILTAGDLDENTAMVLTNVVYFKGEWQYKFEDFNYLYFNSADGQRTLVPGMKQEVDISYANVPAIGASFVELPYKGSSDIIMQIVLPNSDVSLQEVETKLETITLPNLRKERSSKKVIIYMPKFKFEKTIELIPILKEMGIQELFSYRSDLGGITQQLLKVNKIKQKVVIEVNKEGSEAAAATAVVAVFRTAYSRRGDGPINFRVDRPFHFRIIKTGGRNDGIVLFSGNYKRPEYLLAFLLIGYLSNLDNVDSLFIESLESFAVNLYKTVARHESGNVLLSPLSANLALSMVLPGARGNTKNELLQALYLRNFTDRQIIESYHSLHYFLGTNGKINEILTPGEIDSNTAMVLTNVVYFKSEWQYKFKDYNRLYFNSSNGQRTLVPGMKLKVNISYANVPAIGASFVELPYNGSSNIVMQIVLPDNDVSLEEVETRLEAITLQNLRKLRSIQKVSIIMPMFKFEKTIELIPTLKKMGVQELFNYRSDLSGISQQSLKVDKIKQKVVIEVNKDGSEAAAATTAVVALYSSANAVNLDIPFKVNRPFHFRIIKTFGINDGVVLFSGKIKMLGSVNRGL
ncbi:neuroserpin-like [Leptopilina heterotoma]|uniref:neuroserpin-like n=1 Tax=Leptopilina heterotoma TaxID=63436 RepID=UPI001CA870A0|nr:neuroserpin-like [Leptopilina heterotoma]